jgi:gliding motility-associated-like protein
MKIKIQHLLLLFILVVASHVKVFATHNRAGEIQIEQIGPLTIRATVITYTKASSVPADRKEVAITWGDGSTDTIKRVNGNGDGVILQGDIKYNIYVGTHTYPGRGTFRIGMMDPNRNGGILNVNFPQSDAIPFYIQTTYTFLNTNFQGSNSTPRLLQPPIDKGCVGKTFVHNLNAFDPDGDSLAFRIAVPLQDANSTVPLYDLPDRIKPGPNNVISLDERSGQFTWRSPQQRGEYNIAFQIISYRSGVAIDTTIRDMQILVEDCQNDPPKITTIDKICVIAGQTVQFPVTATDPNTGQRVSLTALGGPFEVARNKAVFRGTGGSSIFRTPPVRDTFRWVTLCDHIEEQAYNVVFKAVDNFFDSTGLVDLKAVQIKVVGPPPEDVAVTSGSGQATVTWRKPYLCENANDRYFYAFSVWRREGSNPFPLDTCSPGLAGKGYTRIIFDTTFQLVNGKYNFIDKDVERGKTYCYRILAHFARRTATNNPYSLVASLPSQEVCVQLRRDIPLITNATVEQTNATTGRILVRWTKPVAGDLDTILNRGPYKYTVFKATGITRNNLVAIPGATFTSNSFAGLVDSIWIDNNLNTVQNPYSYKIGFYIKGDSLLGFSQVASSHFLSIASSDRLNDLTWQKDVPWSNSRYDIFRSTTGINGQFDSIGTTVNTAFRDSNLVNKKEYCYYVRAIGSYGIVGVASPLVNLSQRLCGTPIDTVPPCPPTLNVTNNCDSTGRAAESSIINLLKWTNPKNRCRGSEDVVKYNIYYADTEGGQFRRLTTINNINDTTFLHKEGTKVAGCYAVTAIDSIGNESLKSNIVCIDNCPIYVLPNTFTPNDDGQNDIFKPINLRYIVRVEFKVFNRWGGLVFETESPTLDWDGKNLKGTELAEGTYFYKCLVYEQRVAGVVLSPKILSGYIELIRGN